VITKRQILVAGATLVGGLVLILIARQAADATSTSDTAVIESYTLLASRGHLLLGPYSRFQWHHPGPLYFFWMVPFYALAGFRSAGLDAAALALNLVSLTLVVWVITRRAGNVLAISLCVTMAIFVSRSAEVLTSPWNPHISVLPMMALIVTAADAVAGRWKMLPLVAALASLVGQTHVGLLASAVAVGGVAVVSGGVAERPSESSAGLTGRTTLLTALVLVVFWILPLVDQFTGHPGNITRLWTFFVTESHPGQTFSAAFSAWGDMLSGLARPDFYVAHGWRLRESRVRWSEALAIVQIIGLAASAAWAVRAHRRFELVLTLLLALASLLALGSATRIEGAIFDHEVFWISGLGSLNLAILFTLIARPFTERVFPSMMTSSIAPRIGWAVVVVGAIIGVRQLQEAVHHSNNPGIESEAASAVAADLQTYFRDRHIIRPLIRIDQDAWGMAAGVILRLQKANLPVAVEDDWIAMFTPAFTATGSEPVVLTIAGKPQHVRMLDTPGDAVVAEHDPLFVHRTSSVATR
jgi:hypothetical protein